MNNFDITLEGTFSLGPSSPGGGGGGEARFISLSASIYEVQEGASVLVVATTTRPFDVPTVVPITLDTVTSTATEGDDFEWRNDAPWFTFTPGSTVAVAQFQAKTDASLTEGNETAWIDIFAAGDPDADGWSVGTPSRARIRIFDVGNPRINFALAETEFYEGNPSPATPSGSFAQYLIEVTMTSAPVADVTVEVAADYANATLAFGPDLLAPPPLQVLTFTPTGPLSRYVVVQSLYDASVETDEELVLTLQNVTGFASIGAQGTHTIRVLNDDELAVVVSFAAATSSMDEGLGVGVVVKVEDEFGDAQPNHGGLQIPIGVAGTAIVTPNAAGQDAIISWPGGVARRVTIPNGSTSAAIGIQSLEDAITESNETIQLQLVPHNPASNTGAVYTLGTTTVHTSTIVNDDLPSPVVRFSASSVLAIYEQATTAVTVDVEVVDPAATNINQVFSVDLAFSGTATAGDDYEVLIGNTVISNSVTFQPGESSITITIRAKDDLAIEAVETYTLTLTNPVNCTIGTPSACAGTVISNDAGNGGANLRPQFYFPSEVFGRGPTKSAFSSAAETNYLIADLGPDTLFTEDVVITLRAYSPNAVVGTESSGDYYFVNSPGSTTGTITIQAGQRWGQEPFRVNTSGFVGSQKWVVVEMVSSSHGVVGEPTRFCRWTAVILGSTDTRNLIPPAMSAGSSVNNMPATADYQVYNDRIEDVAHSLTLPLPWPNNWTNPTNTGAWSSTLLNSVAAVYGDVARLFVGGSDDARMNGVGIAAHLAQKLWVQRNNPSSSVTDPNAFGVCDTTASANGIYYIRPHVKWLDRGLGVRVDVMEHLQPSRSRLFFGGTFGHQVNSRHAGMVSWNDHHAINGNFYPGVVRDLWIIGNGAVRTVGEIRFAEVKSENFNGRRQIFLDNIHLVDLDVTKPDVTLFPGITSQYWIFGSGATGSTVPGNGLHHGLNYLDGLEFTDSTGQPLGDTYQYRISRFNNPGAWDIRGTVSCPAQQQFYYVDGHGPIFRMYDNLCPAPGVGNGMLQSTQRPRNGGDGDGRSDGPSHGLCAIVGNTVNGMAFNGLGGSDFVLYCVTGSVFFEGNLHRGPVQGVSGGNTYNRAFLKLNVRGNQAGYYAHETFPGSGEFYGFRYAYIGDNDIDVDAGSWGASPFELSGCQYLDMDENVQAESGTNLGSRAFIVFGGETIGGIGPSPGNAAICADPLNNALFGQAVPGTVGSILRSRVRLENRGGVLGDGAGGIRFLATFANIVKNACGSSRPATHLRNAYVRWAEQYQSLGGSIDPGSPQTPSPQVHLFTGATTQYDNFNGTDLV